MENGCTGVRQRDAPREAHLLGIGETGTAGRTIVEYGVMGRVSYGHPLHHELLTAARLMVSGENTHFRSPPMYLYFDSRLLMQ